MDTHDRYMPQGWILPMVDAQNRAFFTSGEVRLQRCRHCSNVQHPPGEVCNVCQSFEFDYVAASPSGVIDSYTIVHHPVHQMLAGVVPYNVAVVSLDDYPQVRVVGNVINAEGNDLAIGRKVCATFVEVDSGGEQEPVKLLQWELVDESIGGRQ